MIIYMSHSDDMYYAKYLKYKSKYFLLQRELEIQHGANWDEIKATIKRNKEAAVNKLKEAKDAAAKKLEEAKIAGKEQYNKAKAVVGENIAKIKTNASETVKSLTAKAEAQVQASMKNNTSLSKSEMGLAIGGLKFAANNPKLTMAAANLAINNPNLTKAALSSV